MVKRVFKEILNLVMVTLLCFVFMFFVAFFVNENNSKLSFLLSNGTIYPLSIVWELFFVISYVLVFRRDLDVDRERYLEGHKFDAKAEMKDYFDSLGKLHLILFAIVGATSYIGRVVKIGKLDYFGLPAVTSMPMAGFFVNYASGIFGLICHVILIPPAVLLTKRLHYKRIIKKSLG